MGDNCPNLAVARRRECRFEERNARYGDGTLSHHTFRLEVFYQRVETGVFRDYVKQGRRVLGGKKSDVVGNVKVKSIRTGRCEENVFGISAQRLNRRGESNGIFD